MKWAIGIDPGYAGAFVLTNGKIIHIRKMPVFELDKEKEISFIDVRDILRTFDDLAKNKAHVFLERAVPFAMGTKSAFNYGRGFQTLLIALLDLDMPYTLVEPGKWAKEMHAGIKKDLKPKAKSLIAVRRLYPKIYGNAEAAGKGGKLHEGVVDALLIALYGLRQSIAGQRYVIEDF